MRVVVAPASFKGTLSAREAATAIADGVRRAGAEPVACPVADGGEGTLDALGWPSRVVRVRDGNGSPRDVAVGVDGDRWAVELARICPLEPARRDVMPATTIGVGEAMRAGLDAGYRRLLVCLGGSGTCDGGAGLVRGLGGRVVGGEPLAGVTAVILPRVDAAIDVACDVDAPLLGPDGAARLYAPQKGASPEDVEVLEAAMARWAALLGVDPELPGAGAAGGTAVALAALGGRLRRGAELVLDAVGFDALLDGADLVVTGEGRIDRQTRQGKAPAAVVARARRAGVPVVALAGRVEADLPGAACFAVDAPPEVSMREPARWLAALAERVVRGLRRG